jgi:fatty-acyl-CoA synthase
VATFAWNDQKHLEAYLAVPAMGAVLHTLNIRLFPDQVVFIANHAEDKVVVVDASLVEAFAKVVGEMTTVEHVLVVDGQAGPADLALLDGIRPEVHRYADLLAAESPEFAWAEPDERAAAAMCYTSGTTGNPKGVVHSHRSVYLHSMAACAGGMLGLSERERVLPVVPMFHANAWGLPHVAWMAGADLALPDRFLQPVPLAKFLGDTHPTVAGAVPTVWNDLLRYAEGGGDVDLSSLRLVACGGSAVPLSLMQAYAERGVLIQQAWGMTETSPCATVARRPVREPEETEWEWRSTAGRVLPGVQVRLTDELPRDGRTVGQFEVRGPWVTASYYRADDPEKFSPDGWLRTGDVGTLDARGFLRITDRAKDVVKSGGVDLERRAGERPHGPPGRRGGRGGRGPRPAVGRAAAGLCRAVRRRRARPGGAAGLPRLAGGPLVAAGAVRGRPRGAADQRGEVRQEGAAPAVRRGRAGRDGGGGGTRGVRRGSRGRLARRSDRGAVPARVGPLAVHQPGAAATSAGRLGRMGLPA